MMQKSSLLSLALIGMLLSAAPARAEGGVVDSVASVPGVSHAVNFVKSVVDDVLGVVNGHKPICAVLGAAWLYHAWHNCPQFQNLVSSLGLPVPATKKVRAHRHGDDDGDKHDEEERHEHKGGKRRVR